MKGRVKSSAAHDTAERAAYARFLEAYPDYQRTASLDALRASDYGRLDASQHAYLDYTGGGLYAASQISEHASLLAHTVFGNPHSASLASATTTDLVEQTRRRVLAHFNAASEYTAVFTLNATAALKLVGESYPFAPGGRFLLAFDNHNSVNGIREFASARGAAVDYAPLTVPDLRLDRTRLTALLDRADGAHPICWPFRLSRTFPGSSIPWVSSTKRRPGAGMSCSMPLPSCRALV